MADCSPGQLSGRVARGSCSGMARTGDNRTEAADRVATTAAGSGSSQVADGIARMAAGTGDDRMEVADGVVTMAAGSIGSLAADRAVMTAARSGGSWVADRVAMMVTKLGDGRTRSAVGTAGEVAGEIITKEGGKGSLEEHCTGAADKAGTNKPPISLAEALATAVLRIIFLDAPKAGPAIPDPRQSNAETMRRSPKSFAAVAKSGLQPSHHLLHVHLGQENREYIPEELFNSRVIKDQHKGTPKLRCSYTLGWRKGPPGLPR